MALTTENRSILSDFARPLVKVTIADSVFLFVYIEFIIFIFLIQAKAKDGGAKEIFYTMESFNRSDVKRDIDSWNITRIKVFLYIPSFCLQSDITIIKYSILFNFCKKISLHLVFVLLNKSYRKTDTCYKLLLKVMIKF